MRTHLIGIGGIGMSGIARLLLARGESVSGSDAEENELIQQIRSLGGQVWIGHSGSHVAGADRVIYSSSISPENPELIAARNRNILVLHRGQVVAELAAGRRTVAVGGAHGKSTTTAMAGQLLMSAGLDPLVILGAEVEALGGNARMGKGRTAVIEADESDGSLLWLRPAVAILTNVDEEHLDYFRNTGEILAAYASFADRVEPKGTLIGCVDNLLLRQILSAWSRSRITYGLAAEAELTAAEIQLTAGGSRYRCVRSGKTLGTVRLRVPGLHNVLNSLAVVGLAEALGIEFKTARAALEKFTGAKRRFQIQGEVDGIMVVQDYGHHPAEILSTLEAARTWPAKRIRCVFQPHRYSRTRYLLRRFSSCFRLADELILLPIYAASEEPIPGVTSERLMDLVRNESPVPVSLESPEGVVQRLAADSKPGDMVLFLGAGSVGGLAEKLVEMLKTVRAEPVEARTQQAVLLRPSTKPVLSLPKGSGRADLREEFLAVTRGRVRFDEPMRLHTTFHIGGPALVWAEPVDPEELRQLLQIAREAALSVTLVSGGANLLVRDEGIPGLVIHLGHPSFQGFERTDGLVRVGAGLPLEWLIRRAKEEGLTGVEFLAGVPGRVGGAVRMNAGTHDDEGKVHAMADVIHSVTVMDPSGQIRALSQEEIGFGYRSSNLAGQIVLETALGLVPDDPERISQRVKRLWAYKRNTQDWTAPSVGCIFKNPESDSAGRLIDRAGLKGFEIGGAAISTIHANFIMNRRNAKAADALALIEEARSRVRRMFDVELQLEVQVLP